MTMVAAAHCWMKPAAQDLQDCKQIIKHLCGPSVHPHLLLMGRRGREPLVAARARAGEPNKSKTRKTQEFSGKAVATGALQQSCSQDARVSAQFVHLSEEIEHQSTQPHTAIC